MMQINILPTNNFNEIDWFKLEDIIQGLFVGERETSIQISANMPNLHDCAKMIKLIVGQSHSYLTKIIFERVVNFDRALMDEVISSLEDSDIKVTIINPEHGTIKCDNKGIINFNVCYNYEEDEAALNEILQHISMCDDPRMVFSLAFQIEEYDAEEQKQETVIRKNKP